MFTVLCKNKNKIILIKALDCRSQTIYTGNFEEALVVCNRFFEELAYTATNDILNKRKR